MEVVTPVTAGCFAGLTWEEEEEEEEEEEMVVQLTA
jgi:hypothetical protein